MAGGYPHIIQSLNALRREGVAMPGIHEAFE